MYIILAKISIDRVDKTINLKKQYKADLVLKNKNSFYVLEEIIDAEFEEINEGEQNNEKFIDK